MSANPTPVSQQGAAIAAAAKQFNVPVAILIGVYGAESTYGSAYGPGATTYGYFGLTSPGLWSPSDTFQQDADIAAQTLSHLYSSNGNSWDAALQAYSGGSYGLSHVNQMEAQAPTALQQAIGAAGGGTALPGATGSLNPLSAGASAVGTIDSAAATAAANALGLGSAANTLAAIWNFLTTPSKWVRVGEFLGGAILIYLAVKGLAGVGEGSASSAVGIETNRNG